MDLKCLVASSLTEEAGVFDAAFRFESFIFIALPRHSSLATTSLHLNVDKESKSNRKSRETAMEAKGRRAFLDYPSLFQGALAARVT
jgi:hypothetical protein